MWRRLFDRLTGSTGIPAELRGKLGADEQVLATAQSPTGIVAATSHGLWLSDQDSVSRVDWHSISKATWKSGLLTLIVADQVGTAGEAVLIADRPARSIPLIEPGKLPELVYDRVTNSIRARHYQELPGGGAWFIERKVSGRDGVILQVRPDQGADLSIIERLATKAAARLQRANQDRRNH